MRTAQTACRLLRGEVLEDRVRLPEDEAVLLEDRHLPVRVQRDELRLLLLALREVYDPGLELDAQVVRGGDHLDGVRRGWKDVQANHDCSSLRRDVELRAAGSTHG